MKGADSYQSGTKETWRNWQWNRIVELLCDGRKLGPAGQRERLRDKTVLYLVGPNDEDRKCAIKRGFVSNNCIAVDIDESRTVEVRKNGGRAICGSLHQVVMGWKRDRKIDVVVADFCHGLTNDAIGLVNAFNASPAIGRHTVVSINLMRGRDAQCNHIRESVIDRMESLPSGPMRDRCIRMAKDRGYLFVDRTIQWCLTVANTINKERFGRELTDQQERRIYLQVYAEMTPHYYDYKSPESGHVFDSAVFRWPIEYGSLMDDAALARMRATANRMLSSKSSKPGRIKQRLAALHAVITMKRKAEACRH